MAPVHQLSTALGIETCVASVRGSRDLAPTGMRVSMLLCRHESDTCGGQGVLGHPTAREERRPCQSCGTGWMESGIYTPRSPHRPDVLCPPEPLSGATALPLNLSSIPGPISLGLCSIGAERTGRSPQSTCRAPRLRAPLPRHPAVPLTSCTPGTRHPVSGWLEEAEALRICP